MDSALAQMTETCATPIVFADLTRQLGRVDWKRFITKGEKQVGVFSRISLAMVLSATAAVALAGPTATASEPYVGFASGTSMSGWSGGRTQAEAIKSAVKSCNGGEPKKDCKPQVLQDLIKVQHGDRLNWEFGFQGVAADRLNATKKWCKPGEVCKILEVLTEAGYFAFAQGADGDGFHLHYGDDSLADAKSDALSQCEKKGQSECKIVGQGAIVGRLTYDDAPDIPSKPVASSGDCRPRTSNLRCSSQCTNGSCTVTYENGCRIHVDVSPAFDGFNNQWTYPSPSC